MSLIPKKVTPEVMEGILGGEFGKNKCVQLKEVLIGDEPCPGVYQIANKPFAEGGFGKAYRVCCDSNCDYVGKWARYSRDVADNKKEYNIQHTLAQHGIAPRVREVWECSKGTFIIMDALHQTLHRYLLSVTPIQFDYILSIIEPLQKHSLITQTVITPENYMDYIGLAEYTYNNIRRKCRGLPSFQIPPDTPEQMAGKKKAILDCKALLKQMATLGYRHSDSHMFNFMNDKNGKWYLIDFGLTKYKPNYKADLQILQSLLSPMIKGRLTYLADLLFDRADRVDPYL